MMKEKKSGCGRLFGRALCLFLTGLGMFAGGCTLSAKDVKLHTRAEMQKILDERYGDAEFVSVEENESAHNLIYTFRDKKYGFTYRATSHPHSVGMDGSTFYYDGASIRYDYEEPFLAYFTEKETAEFEKQGITLCESLKYKTQYENARMYSLQDKMLVSTSDHWQEDMCYVWDRIHSYKKVPELTRCTEEILIYNSISGEYIGKYTADGFRDAESLRVEYFMEHAKGLGGITGEITFLRHEKKKVSEVPGLSQQNFYEDIVKEKNLSVDVYYFEYEGKEYFIVDTWVAQLRDGEEMGGIFQYYQNYKEYRVSGE